MVYENYFHGYDRTSIIPSFSVSKAVVSALVGAVVCAPGVALAAPTSMAWTENKNDGTVEGDSLYTTLSKPLSVDVLGTVNKSTLQIRTTGGAVLGEGKGKDGAVTVVDEYYHRYVVAMLIDERFDLVLDIEPLRPADLRPVVVRGKKKDRVVKPDEDEGELTAALRLLKRVKQTFGWLDVVVGDALYANGPFLSAVKALGLGAVIVARKETDEPLREALRIWDAESPHQLVQTDRERIALWDCPDLETLSTYEGKIRVVKAQLSWPPESQKTPSTWCALVTGLPARRLTPDKVLAVARARWHIENTGFHQWTTRWRFSHVFLHSGPGILALYWLFFAAFNLLSLFVYCQLKSYGRAATNVTRTISRLIDEMLDELPQLAWDTS